MWTGDRNTDNPTTTNISTVPVHDICVMGYTAYTGSGSANHGLAVKLPNKTSGRRCVLQATPTNTRVHQTSTTDKKSWSAYMQRAMHLPIEPTISSFRYVHAKQEQQQLCSSTAAASFQVITHTPSQARRSI